MCGIAGVISSKKENREIAKRIFKSLMVDNETRGKDSTGVLAIDNETKTFSLFKDTIPASIFMNRRKFRQVEADMYIGHTRLATQGAISQRNAHPLQHKDVFLAHNGMISNDKELSELYEDKLEYEVDSEVLIPIVEKEDWANLLKLRGSANFIAWNKAKNRIYIERHDNPLYGLNLDEYGILAVSSKAEVLDMIAEHYSSKNVSYIVKEDTLNIIDIGEAGRKCETIELDFPIPYKDAKQVYPLQDWRDNPHPYDVWDNDRYGWEDKDGHYDGDEERWRKVLEENKTRVKKENEEKLEGFEYDDELDDEDNDSLPFDYLCEACGRDITQDESIDSLDQYQFELCPECLGELDEIYRVLNTGGTIDWKSEPAKKFVPLFRNLADQGVDVLGQGELDLDI